MGMSFQEAIELYREVYHRFEKVEGKPWGVNGAVIELSKQSYCSLSTVHLLHST